MPEATPRLGVDIVNSHHPSYYTELGKPPRQDSRGREERPPSPRETDDPNPVYFLVVETGSVFSFPVMARSEADADRVESLLALGLDWLGVGAKTGVGYGRFVPLTARHDDAST